MARRERPVKFCLFMITVLSVAVVLLTGLSNISTVGKRASLSPSCNRSDSYGRITTAAKDDVSPVVATAKTGTKKIKHYKPNVLARQRNNYGNGNALGYAEESGYGPRGLFFR